MPAEPASPVGYIEEATSGVPPIDGVATSVTAFLGNAPQGPANEAIRINSFADFERIFGGLTADAEMTYGVYQFFLNGGTDAWIVRVASTTPSAAMHDGGIGIPGCPDTFHRCFAGSRADRQGLYALDNVDNFNILVIPGITDARILAEAAAYCVERRAFLIVDAPPSATSAASKTASISGTDLPASDHAAVYFPWTHIVDPLNIGMPRLTPPSGTLAGLYARTDASRGVWKAPAGIAASLLGVQSLALALSDSENGSLNRLGVNCLRTFPAHGNVSWGARTLRGADTTGSEYKYIPVRRLALYIEESLHRGTQSAVFEPNNEALWEQLRLRVASFMDRLFRDGALQGNSTREAYFVKCGAETTTQGDIDNGFVNLVVGFAPLKPAEFLIIRIRLQAGMPA